ncbi:MAG: 5-formyltetrahydrofolate cyclo-ligase [Acholeplasmataceae bacterium]
MTKKDLRERMKEQRLQLTDEDVRSKSQRIIEKIEALPYYAKCRVIGSYVAFNNEVDLTALFHPSASFVYPKVVGEDLHFYAGGEMVRSAYGVLEPKGGKAYDEAIDLLLVPALAISKAGDRIGYGKAFYDRFLERVRPEHVIGVIYDFQEVEAIGTGDHDQRLDGYVKG